jgi:polyisoprenoid-binding protein YceI
MRVFRILVCLVCLLPAVARAQAQSWTLADGSAIRFTALQQGAPVEGRFERFTAEIIFDPGNLPASRIEVEIDTASVATGHKDRDTTLRAPDLFDVERWPSARFASDRLALLGGDSYEAQGQLIIRDVQKDVVLPFELTIADHPVDPGLLLARASGGLTISRLDYGVGQGDWASTVMVGENVEIAIEIVATKNR